MTKGFGAALAAAALAIAPAQGACWNQQEVSAGMIRDFQSMLMVATLRCQVMHLDITGDYNGFLQANKATIQKMNDRLKAHFIKANGAVDGQRAYDAFATSLANGYGAHESSAEVCSNVAALEREAQMMEGSEEGLILLAQRQGVQTTFPEGVCAVAPSTVAMIAPAPQGAAIPVTAMVMPVAARMSGVPEN